MSFLLPSVSIFRSKTMSKALAKADHTATQLDHAEGDTAENKTINSDANECRQLAKDYATMKSRQCGTFYDTRVTCVVPVMIGTKIVGMHLVTGSPPNIINQQAIDSIRQVAPDCVDTIQLDSALELQMVDCTIIKTDTIVVLIKMAFGSEILRMPFYIIESKTTEPIFSMGATSMEYYGISPYIRERCAICQPSGKKAFLVPYLKPDQYADALSLFNVEHLETYARDEIAQEMGIKRIICNTYYVI